MSGHSTGRVDTPGSQSSCWQGGSGAHLSETSGVSLATEDVDYTYQMLSTCYCHCHLGNSQRERGWWCWCRRLLNYQINSRADAGCLSPFLPSLSSLTAPLPPLPWLYHSGIQAPECHYSGGEEDSSVCKSRIQQLQIFLSNLLKVKAIKKDCSFLSASFPLSHHPSPQPHPVIKAGAEAHSPENSSTPLARRGWEQLKKWEILL